MKWKYSKNQIIFGKISLSTFLHGNFYFCHMSDIEASKIVRNEQLRTNSKHCHFAARVSAIKEAVQWDEGRRNWQEKWKMNCRWYELFLIEIHRKSRWMCERLPFVGFLKSWEFGDPKMHKRVNNTKWKANFLYGALNYLGDESVE